jgi:hypothetical protein
MKSTSGHFVQFIGNPDDGFTSAEIYTADDLEDYMGRVFELSDGWYVQVDDLTTLNDSAFVKTILETKDELMHYINRKGAEFPEDVSRAAISLWLMQRDDGKGFSIADSEQ